MADSVFGEELAELGAVSVSPGVVRDQPLDRDAVFGEEVDRAGEELRTRWCLFVGMDLAVREAAAVIDDGVDVVVPGPFLRSRGVPRPWAFLPPPSGVRPIFLTSMWTSSPGRSRS